jgi:Cu(I)/Ag(I) efflux system membrane protein CusA/SilA
MIERIIAFSIRNRFLVIVAGLLLALWGVYALYHTPVDAIPDLSENQVIVFTDWMGHSPHEIEDQITYPLSLHLQGLAGVRTVRSSSDLNFSMINVIFEDGVDFHTARQVVAERLSSVGSVLPIGVMPYLAPDAAATGQIYWYTVEGPGYDLGHLRAIQDWYVRPQLHSVPGVAEVASAGGYAIEYQIDIDPQRMQSHGITLGKVFDAIARSNSTVGGHVIEKGNAEYVVRGVGWIGAGDAHGSQADFERRALRDLENTAVSNRLGAQLRVADVASVRLGARARRGVLEKDGAEVTGGVILMRYGDNPLEVTGRIKQKIQELQVGLPPGVRVVSFYDRTPLIEGAIHTVTGTLLEAIVTASVCVVIVLLHLRTSFIIAVTLPLATLASFATMWTLRRLGIADIQTNIMSLAGIAISIGVLVDASIVMAENVMHHLKGHFGDRRVQGDIRELVLPACLTVGRPIFFSIVIMLLSFLPVFALGGIEGKMFHPLAFTKSFALVAVAALAITLVPALCTIFIKGRLRSEQESWIVRGVIEVYRPVLSYLMDRPAALAWLITVTLLLGLAPLGGAWHWLFRSTLLLGLVISGFLAVGWRTRAIAMLSLVVVALIANQTIQPLGTEFIAPLDEGMVMDMPITVPRASVTQSADDLKARDMMLCRFPEVDMVVGKAGRAETPTDPAPLDMIETMVNFRPREFWPKRKLPASDARRQAAAVLDALVDRKLVAAPADAADRERLLTEVVAVLLQRFDAQMREYAYQRNQEFQRGLGKSLVRSAVEEMIALVQANGSLNRPLAPSDLSLISEAIPSDVGRCLAAGLEPVDIDRVAKTVDQKLLELGVATPEQDLFRYQPNGFMRALFAVHSALGGTAPTFLTRLQDAVAERSRALWSNHVHKVNDELLERGAETYTRLALEEWLDRMPVVNNDVAKAVADWKQVRAHGGAAGAHSREHDHANMSGSLPFIEPQPALSAVQEEATERFGRRLILWRKERTDIIGFGGELDQVMQMPGWTNVWTMPIQNRVDMLSTGVNTAIGIRVLGRSLDDVVHASEDIAAVMRRLSGAVDVVADPIRGKGYVEIHPDRDKVLRYGLTVGDVNELIETALAGRVVTTVVQGRERHAVRVGYTRSWRESEDAIGNLPVQTQEKAVPLSELADIRVVEGPAAIKSENGLLRNYVRLNVRGRDALDVVADGRRAIAERVHLPAGVFVEWTGQFEHEVRARHTLLLIWPVVIALIFLILYLTYKDVVDAVLMVLPVLGALAGGVFFQWLFGYKWSVTVWVGYIACFGMAAATGIIMLVYLRQAVERAGGLPSLTLAQLRQAVMDGAVHRLRPKLLTEGTIVLGLAPMLWASGVGAEVIKPMAAPVLGGILVADEVIDLLLPVLFYWVRRWRWQTIHGVTRR